jgi:hypothetical protein
MRLGSHVIQVRAKNAQGEWSDPQLKVVEVVNTNNPANNNFAQSIRFKFGVKKGILIPYFSKNSSKRIRSIKWISSVDGTLGSRKSINTRGLTKGYHRIALSVQDINGNWSNPFQKVIRVI